MDGQAPSKWLMLVGAGLIALAVADVFMTVLYARAGTGPISHRLASGGWAVARRVARVLPRGKDTVLSCFGPLYLVLLMTSWVGLLLLGFTLLAWPNMGEGVRSTSGPTPTDFLTAFYFAGGSLTTVGSVDIRPVVAGFRFLTVIDSVIGISVLTLAVTYVIQIYTALQRRNALALGLHHASGGTGDAAALLAGLGPGDDFSHAGSQLATWATEVTGVYESHHFYSVLIYFRFREPHYAMARGALITMELVTLIETALDEGGGSGDAGHGWLRHSAAVAQVREGSMHVLTELADIYLPGGPPEPGTQPSEVVAQWRRRYGAALDHLRRAGISVTRDAARGADRYVDFRHQWDPSVMAFARYMEHAPADIDPAGARPATETTSRRELPTPAPPGSNDRSDDTTSRAATPTSAARQPNA